MRMSRASWAPTGMVCPRVKLQELKQHVHDVTVEEADRLAFVEGAVAEAARVLPGVQARFPEGQR
ncbi:hypothetical protein AB0L49_42365 [Streptomyces antimycoticus]|uniref:hypothetical protein n=1 Tax=Streptomyces antimycoticus TaxID=68175 RepID=UPI00342B6359